ncbi:hypothetical protein Mal4_19060 [Maioricimonas rarisocia]|uniref:Uncharacterized protein n=1 Tax=Maioricimonas rarisocia TaxID=2528026 RepID=A0A517Z514_9PLAN|nr:hypothetical protein [Maioricimonas rarisocia]QDU37591.1 hypothetical protein Mal4_19060 [Maioricimonas rarisocia]
MMAALPILLAHTNMTWFLLPLAAGISLVYSASRYEQPERILRRSGRLFAQILLFMGVILALLALLSFRL